MNRDDIIAMAREAGCLDESHYGSLWADKLVAFAALVASAERQRQPITDEDISDLWHQSGEQPFKFARMLLK